MVRGHFSLYVVRNQVVLDFFHQKIVQRKKSEPGLDLFESIYDFNAFTSICIYKFRKGRVTGQLRIGGSQLKVIGGRGVCIGFVFFMQRQDAYIAR